MEALTQPVLLIGLAVILALIIERLLEIFKSIYDYVEARSNSTDYWTRKAQQVRDRLEIRLDATKAGDRPDFDLVLAMASRYLSPSGAEHGGLKAVCADKVRTITTRICFKIIAIILGIICALLFDIDVLKLVELSLAKTAAAGKYDSTGLGILITGMAMGLGAGPLHKLIAALEKARELRRQKEGIKDG